MVDHTYTNFRLAPYLLQSLLHNSCIYRHALRSVFTPNGPICPCSQYKQVLTAKNTAHNTYKPLHLKYIVSTFMGPYCINDLHNTEPAK